MRYLTNSKENNKLYALRGLALLRKQPGLSADKPKLWALASEGKCENHNYQMDVLLALWNAKLIE